MMRVKEQKEIPKWKKYFSYRPIQIGIALATPLISLGLYELYIAVVTKPFEFLMGFLMFLGVVGIVTVLISTIEGDWKY